MLFYSNPSKRAYITLFAPYFQWLYYSYLVLLAQVSTASEAIKVIRHNNVKYTYKIKD